MAETESESGTEPSHWIVPRPLEIVQSLPPRYQWEVTRRHPYYLMFWQSAQKPPREAGKLEQLLHDTTRIILQQINVAGDPVDPSRAADELDSDQLASSWKEGAISPVQIRSLVAILVRVVPPETKRAIAELLQKSLTVNWDDPRQTYELVRDITQGGHPNFDDCLPNLIVTINPRAPQRAVADAIEQIVRDYKAAAGIPEQRRRDDRIDEYLAVWDLREGWTGAGYDCSRELKFKEIARQLKRSPQTVANQYRSAFKYIVGHEYRADLWYRMIGFPKLVGLLGVGLPRITSRRPAQKRMPRAVPESVLSRFDTSGREFRFLEQAGIQPTDIQQFEYLSDIGELISRGRSDDDILAELELGEDARSVIGYLRDHEFDVR